MADQKDPHESVRTAFIVATGAMLIFLCGFGSGLEQVPRCVQRPAPVNDLPGVTVTPSKSKLTKDPYP